MSSDQQGLPLKSPSPGLLEELMPDIRRRTIVLAVVRSLVVVILIVVAYFTLPFTQPLGAGPVAGVVIGLILVATILTLQIRATMQSPYPGMRAFQSLASSGPFFLILFATAHYLIGRSSTHSYSQTMTRLDALYFTLTVFTTVGFGDIAPVSELARIVTIMQMIGDLLLIFVIVRVLFGAVKVGIERRSRSANATPRPQADAAEQSPEPRQGPDG